MNDAPDFVQRGRDLIDRRQFAEAVKICRLGLLSQPGSLQGRLVLGQALAALDRWDEVLGEMRIALETDPSSAAAWLLKGEALAGKRDLDQAEDCLRRARELQPSEARAASLLAEIARARAAGITGVSVEPTGTKEYPARVGLSGGETQVRSAVGPLAQSRDPLLYPADEVSVEYEDGDTQVDSGPSRLVASLRGAPVSFVAPSPASIARDPEDDEEEEDDATGRFLPRGTRSPVEAAKQFDTGSLDDAPDQDEVATPLPPPMPGGDPDRAPRPDDGPISEPAIELSRADLLVAPSVDGRGARDGQGAPDELTPSPRGFSRRDEEEEEQTRQRGPNPQDQAWVGGARFDEGGAERAPLRAPSAPAAAAATPRASAAPRSFLSDEPPTVASGTPIRGGRKAAAPDLSDLDPIATEAWPGRQRRDTAAARPRRASAIGSVPRGRGALLYASAFIGVIAVGAALGLFAREWRLRARVSAHREAARARLVSGNFPGFQAAELLYRRILGERDDPLARATRARVLGQLAFEFGEPIEPAQRAITALADQDSEEGLKARAYVALTRGELETAGRLAAALRRRFPSPSASYLYGRVELARDQPDTASDALRAAAEGDPRNPIMLHGLGLAEAAAGRDDRARDAYRRALEENANHVATIIDRALMEVRHGANPEAARGALEGVVNKLVGDCSAGQLARAYVGLAELGVASGDLATARRALASAAAKRRDGDAQLSEELAVAFARVFELDQAEREATRALAAGGRVRARQVLAEVALLRGRPASALTAIEPAGSANADVLVVRALAKLELGRVEGARLDAEAALRVQPDSIAARVALARVDVAAGSPERAQRELDKLERSTHRPEVAAALGRVFVARRIPERARYWFKEALKRSPLLIEARLALASLLRGLGQLDEAREEITQVLAIYAAYRPARRELAWLALEQGDAVLARDEFDALSDKEPELSTLLGGARAHLQLGDGKGAEERVQRALAQAPIGAVAEEATALLGRAYLVQHRPAEAAALLRKALSTATRGDSVGLLVGAYLDLQQLEAATEVLRRAPPRLRGSVDVLISRARLQIELGRSVAAQVLAEQALLRLKRPRASVTLRAEAHTVVGRALWEQGAFSAAQRALKAAVELDPRNPRALCYFGLVAEELRRPDEARQAMEGAVRNDPRYAEALYHLGRLRAEAGDPRAAEAFNSYLEVAPRGIYAEDARQGAKGGARAPSPAALRKRRKGR